MNLAPLLLILAVFALMWALVLRPQQQRIRQHQALVAAVEVGDQVVTTSGMFGQVIALPEDTVILEVAPGVQIRFARQAIGQRLGETPPDNGPNASARPTDPDGE